MVFDYKKEYKQFYLPPRKPVIVTVPEMNYVAVRGEGNPNEEGGAYQKSVGILYAIAYTIKMSEKGNHKINGFFEYIVPPLEGFWWLNNIDGVDYSDKEKFKWISVIRLPDFVTREEFDWAVTEASKKKKMDCSLAEFLTIEEGLCVQMMHIGSYDEEPASIKTMEEYLRQNGYESNVSELRKHKPRPTGTSAPLVYFFILTSFHKSFVFLVLLSFFLP